MVKPTKIHLITHNHWDREWIFSAKYANRWLPTFFNNLLARLAADPDYRFVLDGQTAIIEDYLAQLPPNEAAARTRDIRRYASRGQLQIGPAYLQPDWSLVSGESLVRNLLIGDRMARAYGPVMKVGWLLDNFGQIAQAPQIFSGFGIKGAFVWRGIEMPPDEMKTEFWWEAPDGSRILGIYLLDSYRNAMALAMTREIARERILSHSTLLRRFAATPNVLLMNGYEQVPEPDDVLPIIDEANETLGPEWTAVQSTPPEYLQAVTAHDPDLPVLRGYHYSGRFAPILKGVYSSRSHLNQQNNECQRELERWAEKFNTFAWAFGFDYPEERFERAWKTLLLNHTHDDLCGCCIDPIARDMADRFDEVSRMAQTMSSESLGAIVQAVDTSHSQGETAIVIFNPSSRPRRELVGLTLELPEELEEFHIHDREGHVMPYQLVNRIGRKVDLYLWTTHAIPAVGYRAYYIAPGTRSDGDHPNVTASADDNSMENKYLRVQINPNGSLTVREKIHDDVYTDLGYFEDGGDCGDTYDYSYPAEDQIITSLDQEAAITLEQAGPLLARFRVELKLKLPRGLSEDRDARSSKTNTMRITSFVELAANAGHVEIKTSIHNRVKDHRLRVIFPSGIETDNSLAGMPFDVASNPIIQQTVDHVPDALHGLMLAGRYTAPVQTHPFQNFVAVANERSSLSIFSRGLSEYEILPDGNRIALTLLRGVGWLARPDLLTREGDVGPHIFTPEAQCLGTQTFEYSIYPHGGDLAAANPHFESDRHTLKFRAIQTDCHSGALADEYSFLSWEEEETFGAFKLTALKQSEDGRDLIVRFYNALNEPSRGRLRLGPTPQAASRVNLNEEEEALIPLEDGLIPVEGRGKEIVTLRIHITPASLTAEADHHPVRVLPQLNPVWALEDGETANKMPALLTQDEVVAEERRAEQLGAALQAIRSEAYIMQEQIDRQTNPGIAQLTLLQRLKGREATLARHFDEAQISALLNRQLLVTSQMEKKLKRIGETLNWARTRKRVSEFLIHYYTGLESETTGD
ncbi:MAG: glycoside hydrolase family 38 C-terminal domain-containing protein [Chloroflexota bacterium]|jgi:mannosylglycerate hydrolase